MKFPKGVTRCPAPKRNNHAGRVWDVANLTLPDGKVIQAHLDLSWGLNFYFQIDGVWRKAPIDVYGHDEGRAVVGDLRDPRALEATEVLTESYENALRDGNKDVIALLGATVEESALASGYNDHRRLAALHTWAEQVLQA